MGRNVGISCNLTMSMSALLSTLSLLTVTKVLWADWARRLLFRDLESRGEENLPDFGFATFLGLSPIGLLTVYDTYGTSVSEHTDPCLGDKAPSLRAAVVGDCRTCQQTRLAP